MEKICLASSTLDVNRRSVWLSFGLLGGRESLGIFSVGLGDGETDCRAQILFKEAGCQKVWFTFEPWVVKGWPIDLVRIGDDRIVYEPLGIDAKRLPWKDELEIEAETNDGLLAWRVEAPFDMVW